MVTVVLTNTNTAEVAVILAFVPRTPQATQRRRTCSSVRFHTTTSNISTTPATGAGPAAVRPAAASGGTFWADPSASSSRVDPDLQAEDA
jgi:hypothetical protein